MDQLDYVYLYRVDWTMYIYLYGEPYCITYVLNKVCNPFTNIAQKNKSTVFLNYWLEGPVEEDCFGIISPKACGELLDHFYKLIPLPL